MASVHPQARIGYRNSLGLGTIIGPNVEIGDDNYVANYVSILGNVRIGSRNAIGTGSVIGGISNHVMRNRHKNVPSASSRQIVHIGDDNLLGEFVTVHIPVAARTYVGNHVNIGTRTHVAHDVVLEDYSIVSIHCGIGGYVKILRGANVGIGANIHPRIVVGQYSMIGVGSVIIRHILPGATVAGNPQRYIKPNLLGMERNGLSATCIAELRRCLSGQTIELGALSTETRDILSHFFTMLHSDDYVRAVSCIPSHAISLTRM